MSPAECSEYKECWLIGWSLKLGLLNKRGAQGADLTVRLWICMPSHVLINLPINTPAFDSWLHLLR